MNWTMVKCGALLAVMVIHTGPLSAQMSPQDKDTIAAITKRVLATRDSLAKAGKTVQFGLSIGVRQITDLKDVNVRNVVISPIDTTLRVDKRDPTDVVLSGMVAVYPWKKVTDAVKGAKEEGVVHRCALCWLGFVANINLASFNADNIATFNKSIEGGIGIAARLTDDFGLAATYERVFSRRLRDFVEANHQIIVDGKPLTAISDDDNRFFIDDNLNAVSFKLVYLF